MKRTTKKTSRKAQLRVVQRDDHSALLAHFAQCPELFAPMLSLIESGKQSIAAVMNQAGRALVELLLQLSASSIAGEKSPGGHSGEVLWHGSQGGQVCLLERRLKVQKPRLRTRGGRGREVAIPLYEQLQEDSGLAAMPQHLPAVTSRALLTGDAARRQLQQQLHQRTPRLVHHRGDALLAALDQ